MKQKKYNALSFFTNVLLYTLLVCFSFASYANRNNLQSDTTSGARGTTEINSATSVDTSASAVSDAAREVHGKSFVEIEFPANSIELTDLAKNKIRSLVEQSNQTGAKIDEILVLSWGDESYPSPQMSTLSKTQIDLASRRSSVVEEYLKSLTKADIDKYNLARQPNIFSKWFNTNDARLKRALGAASIPATKASRSVVIIK